MLLSIITFISAKSKGTAPDFKAPLTLASVLFILAFSLLYTSNMDAGLFELEKRGVLLIYPIVFLLATQEFPKKFRLRFEYSFALLVLFFFSFVNSRIIIDLFQAVSSGLLGGSVMGIVKSEVFYYLYRTYFEKVSGIHPTYASLYLLFSAGVILVNLISTNPKALRYKLLKIIALIVLLIYALFLAAKGPIFAFIISILVVLFLKLKRKNFFVITSAIILLMVTAVLVIPTLKNRVVEFTQYDNKEEVNSISMRGIIYSCDWELLKSNTFIGVGAGDVQEELNQCYETYNQPKMLDDTYNTHNEYINMWLSAGILGLAAILILFALPLFSAFRNRDYSYLFFLLFMFVCFMFENILSRQKGVLFFSLFYLVYAYTRNFNVTRKTVN